MADKLRAIPDRIKSRECAKELLQKVIPNTNPQTDKVKYQDSEMPFSSARIIGFQSYLAMTWAVCDVITATIAPLLLNKTNSEDRKNFPNLLTTFAANKGPAPYHTTLFLSRGYGLPIAVSYIIRNHFVHDGALHFGEDFFEGNTSSHGFQISSSGWAFLEQQLKDKCIGFDQTRISDQWPWSQDNLLNLLNLCNQEIDEALVLLIGSSVGMAKLQARYLLERDLF
jgi:hypothetical protein